jgi:hypothetical protein
VSSFTNTSIKATYSSSTSTSTATACGPTSGTVKQLNYDSEGSIDAFLFTPSGSTTALLVVTGSRASTVLRSAMMEEAAADIAKPDRRAGATV